MIAARLYAAIRLVSYSMLVMASSFVQKLVLVELLRCCKPNAVLTACVLAPDCMCDVRGQRSGFNKSHNRQARTAG